MAGRLSIGSFVLVFLVGCGVNTGSRRPPSLSSRTIHTLTNQQVKGSIGVSSDGNRLAFSNGQNIFTIDLNNVTAQPVQLTNQTSAFTPSFLDNGDIVFGTTSAGSLDAITFQRISPSAISGVPAPTTVQSINAADLRFAANTPLTAPTQFSINSTGTTGIGTINGQPFVIDFDTTPVGVTPLNDVFGEPIVNPVFNSDGSTFAATNASGQVISGPVANGVILPSDIPPVGVGAFPSFTPSGDLTFFGSSGFSTANSSGGFDTMGLGSPATTAAFPTFAPNGSRFFTTSANGRGFIETTIPDSNSTDF